MHLGRRKVALVWPRRTGARIILWAYQRRITDFDRAANSILSQREEPL